MIMCCLTLDERLKTQIWISFLQMIKVGEESGQLDAMLAKVADVFDREVDLAVQRLLTLLERAAYRWFR